MPISGALLRLMERHSAAVILYLSTPNSTAHEQHSLLTVRYPLPNSALATQPRIAIDHPLRAQVRVDVQINAPSQVTLSLRSNSSALPWLA